MSSFSKVGIEPSQLLRNLSSAAAFARVELETEIFLGVPERYRRERRGQKGQVRGARRRGDVRPHDLGLQFLICQRWKRECPSDSSVARERNEGAHGRASADNSAAMSSRSCA